MTARVATKVLVAALSATLVVAVGCGDDTGERDNVRQDGGEEPPDDSELRHTLDQCDQDETACPIGMTAGDELPLAVQLLGPDGNPVEEAMVDFEHDPRDDGAEATDLDAGRDFTDSEGIAETALRTQDANPQDVIGTTVDVHASVPDDDSIEPLEFNIGIMGKDQGQYIIEFEHEGDANFDHVSPVLLDSDYSCDEALNSYLDSGNWPSAEWALDERSVDAGGNIPPAQLPNADAGERFTVVATGEQDRGGDDEALVHKAYGCEDDTTEILDGQDVSDTVELVDHLPHLSEDYEITHQFDLSAALPDRIQTMVDLIDTLANNPAEFLISGEDSPAVGLLDDLLYDYLPESIRDVIDSIEGNEYALEAVHDFVEDWIDDVMPSWMGDGFDIIGDMTTALQEFTVAGQFSFDDELTLEVDSDGRVVGTIDADHTWEELIVQWSRPCDSDELSDDEYTECVNNVMRADDLGAQQDGVIEGSFEAEIEGSDTVYIEQHALTLHYGALMVAIFENIVLPQIFGDNITSVEALFDEYVGCDELASWMPDSVESAAQNMCNDLKGELNDYLHDYVSDNFTAGGDDDGTHLELESSSGCSIAQPDTYDAQGWPGEPRPFIDTFGGGGDPDQSNHLDCDWDVEVTYIGDDTDHEIPGSFGGELLGE